MDYKAQIKKASGKRKSKITGSLGMNDACRYYTLHNGKLKGVDYRRVIQMINLLIQDAIASGEDITLPKKMGDLQLRKFKTRVNFEDGKMITNLPVDWNETLKLWEVDKQAEASKFLVRAETPYVFRLYYKKGKANYNNKSFVQFRTNRNLKLKLKDNIVNGKLDAFLVN